MIIKYFFKALSIGKSWHVSVNKYQTKPYLLCTAHVSWDNHITIQNIFYTVFCVLFHGSIQYTLCGMLVFHQPISFLPSYRFSLSPSGCHVFLPGGAELLFPRRCASTVTQLEWAERRPDRKWVWLGEHDVLLSHPLELRPHGATFEKVRHIWDF